MLKKEGDLFRGPGWGLGWELGPGEQVFADTRSQPASSSSCADIAPPLPQLSQSHSLTAERCLTGPRFNTVHLSPGMYSGMYWVRAWFE